MTTSGLVDHRHRVARLAVPAAAVLAVAARLPFLAHAPGNDEAGFLLVGQQWRAVGTSLYGSYWVDRPPLLITIFRAAAELGGLVPLRLFGCLAAALVVLGAAQVARQIADERAGRWAAVTAAALCISPLLGGQEVNGELLAAPFVLGGMAAVLAALRSRRETAAAVAAALAGSAMVAALLIKQNIADVGVFAIVAVVLAWRRREVTTSRLRRVALAYAGGAVAGLALVAGWTQMHGTSLTGVFDAMYPFRVEAARVMATSSRQHANARLWLLLVSWAVSGGAVIMAVIAWGFASRRLRGAGAWALMATIAFDVASIAFGGSYWHHYTVQLIGPIAVVSGVLVARGQPAIRTVLVTSVAIAAVAWVAVVSAPMTELNLRAARAVGAVSPFPTTTVGTRVGRAVGAASLPHDTIITAWGHADVTQTSGLSSPYAYLWSLPARTLDPRRQVLDDVLRGPAAPTWVVTWTNVTSWRDVNRSTARLLAQRYHPVAGLHGRTVYLRNGARRPTPDLPNSQRSIRAATRGHQ